MKKHTKIQMNVNPFTKSGMMPLTSTLSGLFIFFLLFSVGSVSAQVNIETLRKTDQEEGVHSHLSTKAGLISGNSEAFNLSGVFRTDFIKKPYHLFLVADGTRGEVDDKRYKNKGFVHLRGQRSFTEVYAFEAFTQEEYNELILLEERTLFGGGVRISPFAPSPEEENESDLTFHVGVGLMWEIERYEEDQEDEDSRLLRSTNYLSGKWKINELIQFAGTGYYQVDTARASDFRLLFDGSFGINITKRFMFTVNIDYRFDNEPPEDIKRFDLEITNGITIHF